jgi:hypothetical protein
MNPKTIEEMEKLILFMAELGWGYGKYDDQCFHVFDTGNNTVTVNQAQAINNYINNYINSRIEGFAEQIVSNSVHTTGNVHSASPNGTDTFTIEKKKLWELSELNQVKGEI